MPSSGSGSYDTQDLSISVKAVHGMSGDAPAEDQTGRSDTTVQFPLTITNEGNIEDKFRFSVISQTAQPGWGKHFETSEGVVVTEVDIGARQTVTMYLVVSIDGEEELESTKLTVRVTNLDDNNNGDQNNDDVPDNQLEFTFRAILSDRDFAMDTVIMISQDELTRNGVLVLPPGGSQTFSLKVMNTGDMTDEAIFDFQGLQGTATRTLSFRGMPVDGPIVIPKGWGAYNESTGTFFYESNSPLIGSTEDKIFDKIVANGLVDSHIPMKYYAIFELEIEASSGADNGDSGLLEVVVTSVSNAANRSGKVTFALTVKTVFDINLELDGDAEQDLTFGEINSDAKFKVILTNSGNVESEIRVFSSGGLRGWNIILLENTLCKKDVDQPGSLICTLEESQSVELTVKVTSPGEDTAVEDTFKFILSAEPKDIGLVGRENLELIVNGEPEESGFTSLLNSLTTTKSTMAIGGLLLLGFAILALRRRN